MALVQALIDINAKLKEYEVLLDAYVDGLSPGDVLYIAPADTWPGVASSTDLDAKFTAGRMTRSLVKHFCTHDTGDANIVWAVGLTPPGLSRMPLTFRFTNSAGELS